MGKLEMRSERDRAICVQQPSCILHTVLTQLRTNTRGNAPTPTQLLISSQVNACLLASTSIEPRQRHTSKFTSPFSNVTLGEAQGTGTNTQKLLCTHLASQRAREVTLLHTFLVSRISVTVKRNRFFL